MGEVITGRRKNCTTTRKTASDPFFGSVPEAVLQRIESSTGKTGGRPLNTLIFVRDLVELRQDIGAPHFLGGA